MSDRFTQDFDRALTMVTTDMKVIIKKTKALLELEKPIHRLKEAWQKAAVALTTIRDTEKYKEAGYGTFEAYCDGEWGWTRQRAYQLIEAANVAAELPENVNHGLHLNERQARELAKAPAEKREEVIKRATVHGNGRVTAKLLAQAVEAVTKPKPAPEPEPEPKTDAERNTEAWKAATAGITIPNREQELAKLLEDYRNTLLAIRKDIPRDADFMAYAKLHQNESALLCNRDRQTKHLGAYTA